MWRSTVAYKSCLSVCFTGDDDLIVVHDALDFGQCKLALGIPMTGKFAGIDSLAELAAMPQWTAETPLRVVTGCVKCVCLFVGVCCLHVCHEGRV